MSAYKLLRATIKQKPLAILGTIRGMQTAAVLFKAKMVPKMQVPHKNQNLAAPMKLKNDIATDSITEEVADLLRKGELTAKFPQVNKSAVEIIVGAFLNKNYTKQRAYIQQMAREATDSLIPIDPSRMPVFSLKLAKKDVKNRKQTSEVDKKELKNNRKQNDDRKERTSDKLSVKPPLPPPPPPPKARKVVDRNNMNSLSNDYKTNVSATLRVARIETRVIRNGGPRSSPSNDQVLAWKCYVKQMKKPKKS